MQTIKNKKKSSKPSYFANLDGLRAIAAFSVIFNHIFLWIKYPNDTLYNSIKLFLSFNGRGGNLGVTFFFILSGFLITYLMFLEDENKKKFDIKFFYLRRVLRIWPLYFLTLFIGFVIYPLFLLYTGVEYKENASPLLYAIFAANFDHIYNGVPTASILGVQWSVAVEEQFYLLWPLLFIIFKKIFFPVLLTIIIFFSERFFLSADTWLIGDYHLFSSLRFLAFGGLIAYFSFHNTERMINFFNKINKPLIITIYLICILFMLFQFEIYKVFPILFFQFIIQYQLIPFLFFGFVILEQNYSNNSFFKLGKISMLSWLGKISYGLYLTHMIVIYIILNTFPQNIELFWLKSISTVLLSIIISFLSYRYFESFFLALKNKYSKIQK